MAPDPLEIAEVALQQGDAWGAMLVLERAIERAPRRRELRQRLQEIEARLPPAELKRHQEFRSFLHSPGAQPAARNRPVRIALGAVLAAGVLLWLGSLFLEPRRRYEGLATVLFAGLGLAVLAWAWGNRVNLHAKGTRIVAAERPVLYHAFSLLCLILLSLLLVLGLAQVF